MLPLWVIDFIKKNFKHRFFYARLTRIPLIGAIVDRALFHKDNMVYLPKDTIIQVNQKIPYTNTPLPSQLLHDYIDQAETHFIMNFCICRDSNQCTDYPIDLGCLFMGEAAAKIDPRLGNPATREEAHNHVKRAREAGLVQLIGRNKLDAVWLDTGPDEKLMTVCNCCPCCCLWKMLPNLGEHISEKITAMEGVNLEIGPDCNGCGACAETCFVNAIEILDGKATITEDCRGCGRCVETCPQKAITLRINHEALKKTSERISSSLELNGY